jgi:hypothetical protein
MTAYPYCFGPVATQYNMGEHVVEEAYSPHGSRIVKEREERPRVSVSHSSAHLQ